MSNDFVAKGIATCPVCGQEHMGSILIKKRLGGKPLEDQKTGYKLCEEHQKIFDDGFVSLVEIDESKSKPEEGVFWRTGNIVYLKREIFDEMFDIELKPEMPMCHIDQEVFQVLEKMRNESEND